MAFCQPPVAGSYPHFVGHFVDPLSLTLSCTLSHTLSILFPSLCREPGLELCPELCRTDRLKISSENSVPVSQWAENRRMDEGIDKVGDKVGDKVPDKVQDKVQDKVLVSARSWLRRYSNTRNCQACYTPSPDSYSSCSHSIPCSHKSSRPDPPSQSAPMNPRSACAQF